MFLKFKKPSWGRLLLIVLTLLLMESCEFDAPLEYESPKLTYLDIRTTNMKQMTEEDHKTVFAAMERMGVHDENGFLVYPENSPSNLNISRRLYSCVKKLCNNGNCRIKGLTLNIPLTKSIGENESGEAYDCVGYAIYGMGASQSDALDYVHNHFPRGVPRDSLDSVVDHFFSSYTKTPRPDETTSWGYRPQPMVWYVVQGNIAHAINCTFYDGDSHDILYYDYQNRTSGALSGTQIENYYIPD